ncbi:hypothetical protein ACTMU2_26615 [Cupriavidus basilensis]
MLDSLYVHTRLRDPAACRIDISGGGRHLQGLLRRIKPQQYLSALDMGTHVDEPRDDLASRTEAKSALVPGADFT